MVQPSQGSHCHHCRRPSPESRPRPWWPGTLGGHGASRVAPELALGSWWSSEPAKGQRGCGDGGFGRAEPRRNGSTSRISRRAPVPQPRLLWGPRVPSLALCQPCPRPPFCPVPAAGLTPFVLITGAKENSNVGKGSEGNSSARPAGQGIPGLPGSCASCASVPACQATVPATTALHLAKTPPCPCVPTLSHPRCHPCGKGGIFQVRVLPCLRVTDDLGTAD